MSSSQTVPSSPASNDGTPHPQKQRSKLKNIFNRPSRKSKLKLLTKPRKRKTPRLLGSKFWATSPRKKKEREMGIKVDKIDEKSEFRVDCTVPDEKSFRALTTPKLSTDASATVAAQRPSSWFSLGAKAGGVEGELRRREMFALHLRKLKLPEPLSEREFHAARCYNHDRGYAEYDVEQWTDYLKLKGRIDANDASFSMSDIIDSLNSKRRIRSDATLSEVTNEKSEEVEEDILELSSPALTLTLSSDDDDESKFDENNFDTDFENTEDTKESLKPPPRPPKLSLAARSSLALERRLLTEPVVEHAKEKELSEENEKIIKQKIQDYETFVRSSIDASAAEVEEFNTDDDSLELWIGNNDESEEVVTFSENEEEISAPLNVFQENKIPELEEEEKNLSSKIKDLFNPPNTNVYQENEIPELEEEEKNLSSKIKDLFNPPNTNVYQENEIPELEEEEKNLSSKIKDLFNPPNTNVYQENEIPELEEEEKNLSSKINDLFNPPNTLDTILATPSNIVQKLVDWGNNITNQTDVKSESKEESNDKDNKSKKSESKEESTDKLEKLETPKSPRGKLFWQNEFEINEEVETIENFKSPRRKLVWTDSIKTENVVNQAKNETNTVVKSPRQMWESFLKKENILKKTEKNEMKRLMQSDEEEDEKESLPPFTPPPPPSTRSFTKPYNRSVYYNSLLHLPVMGTPERFSNILQKSSNIWATQQGWHYDRNSLLLKRARERRKEMLNDHLKDHKEHIERLEKNLEKFK
eukprot:g659.t1